MHDHGAPTGLTKNLSRWIVCRKAASAVEFAIIFPLFLMMLFGIIAFGSYLSVVHGVQQLAAEAARASVAGLDDTERQSLAASNIAANVNSYPFITSGRLKVTAASTDPATSVFTVTLNYDASNMFIFNLPSFAPSPPPVVVRSAAIQRGGY